MATIKINEHGVAAVTMSNGKVFPVPPFVAITIGTGACPELITLADGGEWWITAYGSELIDGLAGELADGDTFTALDGVTWTRHGGEVIAIAPAQLLKAAA